MPQSHPPRTRDSDATRMALLRAAQRRFTVLGYARTTTRDIASDAGVNVALIARYFGSKDGLLEAVLHASAELVTALPSQSETELIEAFLAGLRPGSYPEFGEDHPLRLLLRDAGADDRLLELRTLALQKVVDLVAERVDGDEPDLARLRAGLVLALLAGITVLRPVLPDDPLATASEDLLRRELLRIHRAITRS